MAPSLIGATKAYRGYTYQFDGTRWKKGSQAYKETASGEMQPGSDDQYDPLGLYSKEEKAKRYLSETQIREVAEQFGVSYADALEDAKAQGYQAPPRQKP